MSPRCLALRLLGCALAAWGVTTVVVSAPTAAPAAYDRGADLAADLRRAEARNVLVAAHRADWRSHPENSLPAIRSAIAMGVDIVEVDVRRTKDGRFVIIHDTTLDRTTTGRGKVAEMTLEDLRKLRLRDGAGSVTDERVPTLEEALETVRGRALVNVDKSSDHPAEIFRVVEKAGALGYTLFSVSDPLETFEAAHPGLLARLPLFMLVVGERAPDKDALIGGYLERRPPAVLQVVFSREDDPALAWITRARARGVRVWMNALWPHHNAGHHDDRALQDPDAAYGWLVARGATVIQSDRPRMLMEYLHRTGWRR
jgi:glycerophosphoryl diester phosphodiesterase